MNTILLQKILDLLKDNLTGVGSFIKSVFVHDPQDNQILSYDAEIGKWVNKDATEVELDLTNTFEAQAIATLTDGAENVPMKSLVVDIVPKQASGTPTPESPLPITGFTGANITHTGKNLVSGVIEGGSIGSNGTIAGGSTQYDMVYAPIKSGVTYTISTNETTNQFVGGYFTSLPSVGSTSYDGQRIVQYSKTFTAPITGFVVFRQMSGYEYAQLETGNQATTYEPYTATTYPISWQTEAGTVYGDYVDWKNGKLVINKKISTLDGTQNIYSSNFGANGYVVYSPDAIGIDEDFTALESNCYLSTGTNKINIYNGRVLINDSRFGNTITNITEWNDWLSHTNVQVLYTLATPIEIDLPTTPTTIKTRGGTESIFADCGDVSGEYYTKTSESVIALANITEDITSSVTKNTTDFSDILFKASKNNKVVSIEIYSASTSSALISTFLSNLPKPAMNCKVLLANTTLGEDGIILGTLKTTGELEITTSGAKSFSGIITYVEK